MRPFVQGTRGGPELRAARQAEVLLGDSQNERAVRLGGALFALGLATWHP
ncbi:MAG TPA: hypothetical protein VE057_06060 [Archangium sp.]|nr:hypothetical protein [Archangium sp.]